MQYDQCMAASLKEDLKQIGCSQKIIDEIIISNHPDRIMQLLYQYRLQLLNKLHEEQKQLDMLDELLYRLKTSR